MPSLAPQSSKFRGCNSNKDKLSLSPKAKLPCRKLTSKQEPTTTAVNISNTVTVNQKDSSPKTDVSQRRLATASATFVIGTPSISSSPPSSQSYTQTSMTQLHMTFRPGSSSKGQLVTSSDSLDTEYSTSEDEPLVNESVTDASSSGSNFKGILKTGTKLVKRPADNKTRRVHFSSSFILASRCVEPDVKPLFVLPSFASVECDAEAECDADTEDDDDDYEDEDGDEDENEDENEDDSGECDNHSEEHEEKSTEEALPPLADTDEEEETDTEDIAQINKILNQKIPVEESFVSISFTDERYGSSKVGPAMSLLSNGGFPPSSPESVTSSQVKEHSFSEVTDGLLDQTPISGRHGIKRNFSHTSVHMFLPVASPSSKKRRLCSGRVFISAAQAKMAPTVGSKRNVPHLVRGSPQLKPTMRKSSTRVL